MSDGLTRRDFLKLAGAGAATTGVLTGCGPASRYVRREPYMKMPEYSYNGASTYYATTCRECSAGCGLVVRTMQGRAIKVEGNPDHPVNAGKTCARGQATLQGLYNPDRVTGPVRRPARGEAAAQPLDWEAAIDAVAEALRGSRPSEIAFLLGRAPDHVFDFVTELTEAMGAPPPLRLGALGLFEARATLSAAAEEIFGQPGLPFFDLGEANVVLSFGANFLETWLSPVAYTRGFARMRRGHPEGRGYLIQFEPRMSQTAAKADEWIPIRPGTEALVALAIGRLAVEARGEPVPRAFAASDPKAAAEAAGIPFEQLERIATLYGSRDHRGLALPGGAALAHEHGIETARAVLALNAAVANLGRPGGVFLSPLAPGEDAAHIASGPREASDFIQKMASGDVKVLFIHGVNPLFELPQALGFANALSKVPRVFSFATFPDETALQSDFVLPDHHGLESWGYQRPVTGATQSVLSGSQPVVSPNHNTRATIDVLLAASKAVASLVVALPYSDEVEYVRSRLTALTGAPSGFFAAEDIETFAARFQQHGGWWTVDTSLTGPAITESLNRSFEVVAPADLPEGEFHLFPFVSPTLAESGANKPWLQELPDPTTTVMWNSWVEINPATAHELGLENDDLVVIHSDAGAVEAPVYLYPAIRPDVIAIPFGQGHTAFGRYAAGRGVNPLNLLAAVFNPAGDLAFAGMRVRISKTGRRQFLSRLESRIGVYGEGMGEH